MMERKRITSGSSFESDIAYCRAIVAGDWVLVSGTTGFDYSIMTPAEGVVEQTRQALRNIEEALLEAGAALDDVVRVTYVLPDPTLFPQTWPVLREAFGAAPPTAMMIAADLMDPAMLIEIEVTAFTG